MTKMAWVGEDEVELCGLDESWLSGQSCPVRSVIG
jgi:hypothetical protein